MQDEYYFATSPWLIGDQSSNATDQGQDTMVLDRSGLRQGQMVRISAEAEPQLYEPARRAPPAVFALSQADEVVATVARPAPVILQATDRSDEVVRSPGPLEFDNEPPHQTDSLRSFMADVLRQQQVALAQIEQASRHIVASLEDRLVATLAAIVELAPAPYASIDRIDIALVQIALDKAGQAEALVDFAKAIDRLAAKVEATPKQNEVILRDVADIRAGLVELRVQARMIEMQLFSLNRNTDAPLARPLGSDHFGAKLAETLAS